MSKKHKKEDIEQEQVNQQTTSTESNVTDSNTQAPQGDAQQTEASQANDDKVAELTTQLEEMKDKYLRLTAEFDNYRKRTLKEKAELIKFASEEVLKDLLPVIDDLDRALKAIETANDINAVKEGISLIVNKFNDFLKAKGVKEIDAIGKELDTDLHEAITKIPVQDDAQKGKIVDVIQKGYMLHEKVMRFSKVVVGE
ncbi:nucleotide exchange factor GrpE [Tenuifilum sp.]|jgi:molecular chaperone GrpE|uniref:nucleotide exchange factor GrpE n=1 Tax=Tenuifilum sp. TaxID=2760880 RepID=UPI001B6397A6|nr:nucleotide exchange factor GrpE [Bacteroidales bacterium]HOK60395.1 nucleotide exchange factor GrpE [Tenuifilum sp.]HOK85973.1 nucleotide exchange factor GrpE [Tenuifilum sp.]HPP90259.1 nucleotide exchange factor GrpE [Tenuifilum sp.]HRR12132.1 nucleotide exchange factor GrpE [Tenuifilum sp.]